MDGKTHLDCENYTTIDVYKGFCQLNKKVVMADDGACESFKQVARCKVCTHFSPTEENLGTCMGKVETFPNLLAKTCEDFTWKE